MYEFYVYQTLTIESPGSRQWVVEQDGEVIHRGGSAGEAVAAIADWLEDDNRAPDALLQDTYDIMFRTPSEEGLASGIMSSQDRDGGPFFYLLPLEIAQDSFWNAFLARYGHARLLMDSQS